MRFSTRRRHHRKSTKIAQSQCQRAGFSFDTQYCLIYYIIEKVAAPCMHGCHKRRAQNVHHTSLHRCCNLCLTSSICILYTWHVSRAHYERGVRCNVDTQSKRRAPYYRGGNHLRSRLYFREHHDTLHLRSHRTYGHRNSHHIRHNRVLGGVPELTSKTHQVF